MPETDPINNWLFAAMSEADQQILRPSLVRHAVAQGDVIFRRGDALDFTHFPVSAQVANVMIMDAGTSLAVSTVGREGVTGLAALLADKPIGWDGVVHVGGVVWSAPADAVRTLAAASSDFSGLLLRAAYQNQLDAHAQASCAAFHLITPRLATWLLTLQDRTGLSSFTLKQDDLARIFGVRRATIAEALIKLKERGTIANGMRGRIVVQDRNDLKQVACSCYSHRFIA
jgi:CRP-like cAMP-binding protein